MKRADRQSKLENRGPKVAYGFTLIEVTIAITLLALMMAIIYGAFFLGHRAVERAQIRADESQKLRSVGQLLGGYIRSAYPYRSSPRDPGIFFAGDERGLRFVSTLSMGMGGRGVSKVEVGWDGGEGGGGVLTLEEEVPVRLNPGASLGGGYRNSVVLGEQVTAFRLEYLDPQSQEERWVPEWDAREKKALPRAVRFSFRGAGSEEIEWIFPIMMSALAP